MHVFCSIYILYKTEPLLLITQAIIYLWYAHSLPANHYLLNYNILIIT
jgi:hypothetical protein